MNTIKIIIEKSVDFYDAYAENCEGIYGAGASVDEAKENALKGLELLMKTKNTEDLPEVLKGEYTIVYQFDTQSFLNYYNQVFTNVALERLTGINQKLLHHYATGLKIPRERQRKKIEIALHKLGSELLSVQL